MGPYLLLLIISALLLQAGDTAYDPVAELAAKVAGGQASVQFETKHGYLKSLLDALKIPVSSQTLVFSKTSLQTTKISPTTPRALYFNEDNYVAWVPGASLIEIMSVRPGYGSVFYMLENNKDEPFGFSQSTGHECAICHFARESPTKFVPKLLFESVIPDRNGGVEGTFPIPTTTARS